MEEVLDDTLYQDDFLTKTITTSSLYDKSHLDLTFIDNNNYRKQKSDDGNHQTEDTDSPDLDFLKLGSPDLEQMFMNIHEETVLDDALSNDDDNSSNLSTTAFNIEDDLVNADNCFTEALQQLHDKQITNIPLDLIDIPVKVEKEEVSERKSDCQITQQQQQQQQQQQRSKNSKQNKSNNKVAYQNHHHHHHQRNPPQQHYQQRSNNNSKQFKNNPSYIKKNTHRDLNNTQSSQHQHIINNNQQHQRQMPLQDQLTMNNQLAILNAHQMHQQQQQQQQQQEIVFLTQAMGYQQERENIQTNIMNNSFTQQMNTMPHQIQQKIFEQHLIHQQISSNGYPNNDFQNQMEHMQHINALAALGIDEHTLKMFVENPHMAPINLEIQELIKRERKKLRNRIASSKCRKRKLEREGRLEDKVKILKEKNIELNAIANALKQQICDLKQRVMEHVSEGCQIVLPS